MKSNYLRNVLLVEDNLTDAEMTIEALRDAGIANPIIHVEDGVEAIEFLEHQGAYASIQSPPPVVMLLDLSMPRLDGFEVLKHIRKITQFRSLPIIVLSSSREESDLVRSWELGVNAYVVKPVNADQYSTAIRRIAHFWLGQNELPEPSI